MNHSWFSGLLIHLLILLLMEDSVHTLNHPYDRRPGSLECSGLLYMKAEEREVGSHNILPASMRLSVRSSPTSVYGTEHTKLAGWYGFQHMEQMARHLSQH